MKEKEIIKGSLLSRWKNKKETGLHNTSIEKAPVDAVIPLSHGQQQLWFLQQLYPQNPFYNYSEGYALTGKLQVDTLLKAIKAVCGDHEILFSNYHMVDGKTVQMTTIFDVEVPLYDLSELPEAPLQRRLDKISFTQATTSFDLSQGPLFKICLVKTQAEEHLLLFTLHHIITDKWSMGVFREQLGKTYRTLSKAKLPISTKSEIQYRDYAYWQKSQKLDEAQLDYWRSKLHNVPAYLDMPLDTPRPVKPSFKGVLHTKVYSKSSSEEILGFAKKLETTPYTLLLTVYKILLFRYSGQKDILVGSPISNRNDKILENLIGFFNDTVVLRSTLSVNMTFKALLKMVRADVLTSFSNKDIPFDYLVKSLKPARLPNTNPFFQVMFLYHAVPEMPSFGADLKLAHVPIEVGVSKFDLTLYISEENGILSTTFEYATDVFNEATIERFQEFYQLLLQGVLKNPHQEIAKIPMAFSAENVTVPTDSISKNDIWSNAKGIHSIIAEEALKNPNKPAVSFKDEGISYGELNNRAAVIAGEILDHTSGRNEIVGLCLPRSIDMIVGLLAILKSGCAYLPLDPEYPEERLKFMLNDTAAALVVTNETLSELFEKLPVNKIEISKANQQVAARKIILPEVQDEHLAYVIYTSGSTGKPKGVPITHGNIINSTKGRLLFYKEQPSSFLLLSSIAFDSSKAGIFWTLCTGGNLVIAEKRIEQDMLLLEQTILRNKISHLLTLPTLYHLILDHISNDALSSLTTVIVAGETCPVQLPEFHFRKLSGTRLYNEYGPTETTVWCIAYEIKNQNYTKSIPIGQAIDGVKIYLLDVDLQHVPFGAVGEIYISGDGVSSGYLNNQELTNAKFLEDPFSSKNEPSRMYKSGDLAKYLPDGNIEFLGRTDSQIKLRGFRIELDEIDNMLLAHPEVAEASVVVTSAQNNSSRPVELIVAYLVLKNDFGTEKISSYLKERLPKYMVPSKLIALDGLIKLPNGKIDKNHLAAIPMERVGEKEERGARTTETEKKLIAIWEEVLGYGGLSIHDNFFEIGGDSIMTIQVISKARKADMVISPNQLFEYQTIGDLAKFIDDNNKKEDQWDYLVPLRKGGSKKPLFCIHAGGGHVFFYNKLTDYLNAEIPVFALQPSGVYGDKNMHTSVRAMSAAYLESIRKAQPHGPYNILVYCFSASVGNEMALMLKEMDEEINLIVMDTMTAPAVLNTPRRLKIRIVIFLIRFFKSPIRSLKQMIFSKYSVLRMRWRSKFETDEESRELEKLRANLMYLSHSYQFKPFKGRISLILTPKDHESLNREAIRSWKEIAEDELNVLRLSQGNHRELFEVPYVEYTAEAVQKCMVLN